MSGAASPVGVDALVARELQAPHGAAMRALHEAVFGAPCSAQWADWKYGEGEARGLGLWDDAAQEMVAFCGGLPRMLWWRHRRVPALQVGDVMVRQAWRGVLRRHGAFYRASAGFYESALGPGSDRVMAYGFPNARHMALAERLELAHDAGPLWVMHWGSVEAALGLQARPWRLMPDDPQWAACVQAAWQRMQSAGSAWLMGQRDAGSLHWRYQRRPQHPVQFWVVPDEGRDVRGVLVLDMEQHDPAMWLDWIGAPQDVPLALRAVRQVASTLGLGTVQAWVSSALRERLSTAPALLCEQAARIGVPRASAWLRAAASPWGALPPVHTLPWWFMGGDTDFL